MSNFHLIDLIVCFAEMYSNLFVLFFSNQNITIPNTYSMNFLQPDEDLFIPFENQLGLLLPFENLGSVEIVFAAGRRVAAAVGSR